MQYALHNQSILEVTSKDQIIKNSQDVLNLMFKKDVDAFIVKKENFIPQFFDLSSGVAGDILQKFSNYQKRLAIVGDFSNIQSQALRDFIYESNRNKQIIFVKSTAEALKIFKPH
jgi:hypothetical protein